MHCHAMWLCGLGGLLRRNAPYRCAKGGVLNPVVHCAA